MISALFPGTSILGILVKNEQILPPTCILKEDRHTCNMVVKVV